jgi:hypothetical protein
MKTFARGTVLLFAAAVFVLAAGPASAETSWGPRAGMSFSPDQIALGAHVRIPVATNLSIIPNADIAFGDDLFTIGLHGDLTYSFSAGSSLRPYLGGGFSFYNYDPDNGEGNSETGVSALGGIWLNADGSTPFFIEGKLYFSDNMPDFKLMAGVNM